MYSVLNTLSKYTYQKTLLYTLLLLVFKIVESLQGILNFLNPFVKMLGLNLNLEKQHYNIYFSLLSEAVLTKVKIVNIIHKFGCTKELHIISP